SQGPGTNTLITVVSDNVQPIPLYATNSFNVVVTEVNTAPVLPVQPDRTIDEQTTLQVTNTASDSDLPANVLTYALLDHTPGASIGTNNGIITWTPDETQGPSTNILTTVVSEIGTASPLSATNHFTVVVREVNQAPVLPVQIDRTILESSTLVVTNT